MSLHDCLQRAIDGKELDSAMARQAQQLFAERLAQHAHLGQAAEQIAAEDVLLALQRNNQRKKRYVALQATANLNNATAMADHVDSNGQPNAASALRQFIEWGQSARHQSVEAIRQALEMSYLRDIGQLIDTHRINLLGNVRQKARLPNLVRELKGEGTGDPHAKAMADAVRATIERARQEFNAAGGEIGKLEGYDLPHHWDRDAVSAITPEDFAARFHDDIDWGRITDFDTSQPFTKSTKAAREKFLMDIHKGIKTAGWDTRNPSGTSFAPSLAKSRAAHRVLHFKTADGWLAANEEFGTADPYSAIIAHLQGMARDTAQMRVLGPNPAAGLEFLRQSALKQANERPWNPSRVAGVLKMHDTAEAEVMAVGAQAQRMLDMISGAANMPEMGFIASVLSGTRHFLVASQLGGAMLSSVSDVGFMAMASRHVGIDPGKVISRHLKTLTSANSRAVLARAGLIAESAASTGVVQARIMGEAYGPKIMQRLSEFTLRASGLTAWTDIARGAFQLEFYGLLAENAGRAFADIDAPLRELVFEARGITAAEWDIIRTTTLHRDQNEPDATFLIPDDIRRRADLDPDQAMELSLKLGSAIREQLEFAVPNVNLRGKSSALAGTRPGSVGGEFLRSALMHKNFTISLMFNQLGRVIFHKVRGSRGANVVMFGLLTTAMGALTIQLKELAKGRDPVPMTDGKFLKAAMIQGGGLGIFGDFIYSSENRFGGGFASTLAGPVAALATNGGYLTTALVTALTSRDPKAVDAAQKEAIRFANQYSGPTNLWYLNAAFDRLIWDGMSEWTDPEATKSFARAEKKRLKEFGNSSYWQRGQPLPARLPDLSNIIGDQP